MDRKYVIISVHYDDEFVGCHQFIQKYRKDIIKVIYFTDSSLQANYIDTSTIKYIQKRKMESTIYLRQITKEWELFTPMEFLDLPDGLSREEYDKKCFPTFCIDKWITEQLAKYITDETIVYPCFDSDHPSHIWCNAVSVNLINRKRLPSISYATHSSFDKDRTIYNDNDHQFRKHGETNPVYLYKHPNGLKHKLFMGYFPSQAKRMLSSGLKLNDYERYYTNLKLKL